ncbi:MAG TPA: phenylacetate--CoA ligase family protein [Candidatus Krumholzibacteria bacterium]|nr:phenylacetate--CoA ligase family protein [Candidatus Krumholzibacteria bacterium]
MARRMQIRPSWRERIQLAAVGPRDVILYLVCRSFRSFVWSFERLPGPYLAWSSRVRSRRAFYRASRRVPAYAEFLAQRGATRQSIPETDKASYIQAFSPEARCVAGRLPEKHTMIDESSGSTGTPYNWVRNVRERRDSHLFISYFARYCYGDKPWITINAFSMGAWATGLNMGLALQGNSVVKNTGPDLEKIMHTLAFFGPDYPYLIMGYPPFLKQVIDVAETRGFPLHDYRLNALVGGEGMSEGLRDYLLRRFHLVYSGYGATDLEIGIAGETPVSVAIRRLAKDDARVRARLFGPDSRLPMVFQYNPLMHHIEVNENREVIFTITRANLLSPRIRYNVHDEGGVMRYDQMARALKDLGRGIETLVPASERRLLHLPFLWIYGRRDFTISVMGANIYPEDLEQCIYANPKLAQVTRSFCQSLTELPDGGVKPAFFFEVDVEPDEALRQEFAESILKTLVQLNADFRAAWNEYPETLVPDVQLYGVGQGPFTADAGKIKQARVLKKP